VRDDSDEMISRSAFFRRGGSSSRSHATVSDSAYDQRSVAIRKAESQVDLSDNGLNPLTDPEEVSKIDLGGFVL